MLILLPSLTSTSVREGESFESWLHRFSSMRWSHPSVVLADLGYPRFLAGSGPRWFWSLGDEVLERVSVFSRVPIEALRAAEFSAQVGDLFPSASTVFDVAESGWVSVGTLRFCPYCLADGSGSLWRWRLGCVVACSEHQVLLRLGCEACGRVRCSALVSPPHPRVSAKKPGSCPQCEASLMSQGALPASDEVLEAQRIVDAALIGAAFVFGDRVGVDVWLDALTSTAALSMFTFAAVIRRKSDRSVAPSALRVLKRRRVDLLTADPAKAADWFASAVGAVGSRAEFESLLAASVGRLPFVAREPAAEALVAPAMWPVAVEVMAKSFGLRADRRSPHGGSSKKKSGG